MQRQRLSRPGTIALLVLAVAVFSAGQDVPSVYATTSDALDLTGGVEELGTPTEAVPVVLAAVGWALAKGAAAALGGLIVADLYDQISPHFGEGREGRPAIDYNLLTEEALFD